MFCAKRIKFQASTGHFKAYLCQVKDVSIKISPCQLRVCCCRPSLVAENCSERTISANCDDEPSFFEDLLKQHWWSNLTPGVQVLKVSVFKHDVIINKDISYSILSVMKATLALAMSASY